MAPHRKHKYFTINIAKVSISPLKYFRYFNAATFLKEFVSVKVWHPGAWTHVCLCGIYFHSLRCNSLITPFPNCPIIFSPRRRLTHFKRDASAFLEKFAANASTRYNYDGACTGERARWAQKGVEKTPHLASRATYNPITHTCFRHFLVLDCADANCLSLVTVKCSERLQERLLKSAFWTFLVPWLFREIQ